MTPSSMSSYTKLAHHDDKTVPSVEPDVVARFEGPHPHAWKRAMLVTIFAVLFWFAFYLRPGAKPESKVIYASRYSKEFKFRPAASPVITERLKDGRVRLRGALPT